MFKPRLQKVKPFRRFEGALNQIQELIVDGHLRPGERLPSESELSSLLDMSRSSIREALRTLESKGLVYVRPGDGSYVSERPPTFGAAQEAVQWLIKREDWLLQLLEVREVVEGLAGSLAARGRVDSLVQELRSIVDEQRRMTSHPVNLDKQVELDARFHMRIAQASGNGLVQEIINSIVPAFIESNRAVLYISTSIQRSLQEHCSIVDALADRDSTRAEAALRAHISRVRRDVQHIKEEASA